MGALTQKIRSFDDGSPQILKFSNYHGDKNAANTELIKPVRKIKVVIPQQESSVTPISSSRNDLGFISATLTSAALAIGASTTNILNQFSNSAQKYIKLGLNFIAISFITITIHGVLNRLSGKSIKSNN